MHLIQYATEVTIPGLKLITTGSTDYQNNPTLAAGDVRITKDGGSEANLATLPEVAPAASKNVSMTLSATETQGKVITVNFIDQTGSKEWIDNCFQFYTYGHPSAFLPFDFSTGAVSLNAPTILQLITELWAAQRSAHTVSGSFGQGVSSVQGNVTGDVQGNVDGDVEGDVLGELVGQIGAIATGAIVASSFAADAISATALSQAAAQKIADEMLNRNLAGGGSGNTRNVRNALRSLRNRIRNNGGTLEIYQEDDTTLAWSAVATTSASNPIVEIDPS